MERLLFTSESVTEGHPDKICDQISDAVLDALLEQDPMSRVACETAITTGLVLVMGEITTNAYVDIQKLVRETIDEIGYNRAKYGFDAHTCGVVTAIDEQSADIALGVDKALEAKENKMSDEEIEAIGAGDQGMMFGYASNETEEFMPYPIALAHKLALRLTKVRKDGTLPYLRPDGKTQVTVEYDENGVPARLDAVVLSTQHDPEVTQEQIHADVKKYIFDEILPAEMVDENTKFYSTRHIEKSFAKNDTAKLFFETRGVLLHELTHAYQLEPQGIGSYGTNRVFWAFIEGMADAVRVANGGFDGPNARPKGGNYMDGYRTAGYFFVWLRDNKDPEFLRKFNRSTLEVVPWSFDGAIKHILGNEYNIDELWHEYQVAVGDVQAQ